MNGDRFSRAQADEAVAAFLRRIFTLNAYDAEFRVNRVVGYGSYFMSDRDPIGDIDLAIQVSKGPLQDIPLLITYLTDGNPMLQVTTAWNMVFMFGAKVIYGEPLEETEWKILTPDEPNQVV